MLLNEIFGGARQLLKKGRAAKGAGRSEWAQNFVDSIKQYRMYWEQRHFKGHDVEIIVTPEGEGRDLSELALEFTIDGSTAKAERRTQAQSGIQRDLPFSNIDNQLTMFSFAETLKLGAQVLQEVRPKKLSFSATVSVDDDQALKRVNLYDRLVNSVKPDLEKLGYTISREEGGVPFSTEHAVFWDIRKKIDD